jgi:hypothetical protein
MTRKQNGATLEQCQNVTECDSNIEVRVGGGGEKGLKKMTQKINDQMSAAKKRVTVVQCG